MEPFTPNTQVVRRIYIFDQANEAKALGGYTESTAKEVGEEFDRWLTSVKAEAWDACARSIVYEDGTPVEIASITNPYK